LLCDTSRESPVRQQGSALWRASSRKNEEVRPLRDDREGMVRVIQGQSFHRTPHERLARQEPPTRPFRWPGFSWACPGNTLGFGLARARIFA
jgi:hypothetical protein